MTSGVCRLAFPAGCDCCHPFENLRREGVNGHGPVQMSGADTTVFCAQKSVGAVHLPWTARRVVAVSARARGLTRSDRKPCGMSRQTQQRRSAAAKRRCTLQPGVIGLQGAPSPARQGGGSVYGHCTPGLRQDGNPLTRNGFCVPGPGRDSPAGSVRSMTADRTPGVRDRTTPGTAATGEGQPTGAEQQKRKTAAENSHTIRPATTVTGEPGTGPQG